MRGTGCAFSRTTVVALSLVFFVHREEPPMGRCSAGAAECATTKTNTPLLSPPCAVPTIVSTWKCAMGRRTLTSLSSSLLSSLVLSCPPVSMHLVAVIRRTLRAAYGTTVVHQSRIYQSGSQSSRSARTSSLGRRAITIKHESIRWVIYARIEREWIWIDLSP